MTRASYGAQFCKRIEAMGISEVVTAARSPWQNAYVERLIGSIRRECLDHVIVGNERHLLRMLSSYAMRESRGGWWVVGGESQCGDPLNTTRWLRART